MTLRGIRSRPARSIDGPTEKSRQLCPTSKLASKHRIVVSAENNPYMAWQAKLFYFSCVTRLSHQPIIVVHDTRTDWHPDFFDLARAGALIRSAPSYAVRDRPPRNTAGTLLHAAPMCAGDEFIVLCDPDMIFVRKPKFPEMLSGNFYSYLDYDRRAVQAAAEKLGVRRAILEGQKRKLRCGVPYVIPVTEARRLAEAWLEAVDAFPPRGWLHMWTDIMYAFGLAVMKLGLTLTLTHMVDENFRPDTKLRHDVVHYCWGDNTWDKRRFFSEEDAEKVWAPLMPGEKGTVLGEILSQIQQARDFYRNIYFDR